MHPEVVSSHKKSSLTLGQYEKQRNIKAGLSAATFSEMPSLELESVQLSVTLTQICFRADGREAGPMLFTSKVFHLVNDAEVLSSLC